MAHETLLNFPASSMFGDTVPMTAGDLPATPDSTTKQHAVLDFDDTDEAAAVTPNVAMPGQYAAGTLKATLFWFMATDHDPAHEVKWQVGVEAVTPSDAMNFVTSESFDAFNDGDNQAVDDDAGEVKTTTITLTNKDSVAVGDTVRFIVRRDSDAGAGHDDAVGDACLLALEIWEDT